MPFGHSMTRRVGKGARVVAVDVVWGKGVRVASSNRSVPVSRSMGAEPEAIGRNVETERSATQTEGTWAKRKGLLQNSYKNGHEHTHTLESNKSKGLKRKFPF